MAPKRAPTGEGDEDWTDDERAMRDTLVAGQAVIANGHRHKQVIAWAMARDLARYITAFRPRVTIWGNPYRPRGASRGSPAAHARGVERFRDYLDAKPELRERLPELAGKLLICYCKPLPCHGDVLVERLDGLKETEPGHNGPQ